MNQLIKNPFIILLFIGVLYIIFFFINNSRANDETNGIIVEENSSPELQSEERRLTRSDFNFLEKGQDISYVIEKLGPNYRDVGSGFYIIIYEYDEGFVHLRFGLQNELADFIFVERETKDDEEKG